MNKLTFEELPQAVSEIFSQLKNIERILQEKNPSNLPEAVQILTIKQAAEFLSLSVPTLYGYVHRSEILYSKVTRRLYFSRQELTDWIKTGRRKTVLEINASADGLLKRKK